MTGIAEEIREKKISEIRSKSEFGRVVHVQANTVHDLMADIRFLLSELEQVKKVRDGWKGEADYWQRKEREAHLLIQSLHSELAACRNVLTAVRAMLNNDRSNYQKYLIWKMVDDILPREEVGT